MILSIFVAIMFRVIQRHTKQITPLPAWLDFRYANDKHGGASRIARYKRRSFNVEYYEVNVNRHTKLISSRINCQYIIDIHGFTLRASVIIYRLATLRSSDQRWFRVLTMTIPAVTLRMKLRATKTIPRTYGRQSRYYEISNVTSIK